MRRLASPTCTYVCRLRCVRVCVHRCVLCQYQEASSHQPSGSHNRVHQTLQVTAIDTHTHTVTHTCIETHTHTHTYTHNHAARYPSLCLDFLSQYSLTFACKYACVCVFVCTCTGSGVPQFDAIVIDEAAQALEPATIIPFALLKQDGKVPAVFTHTHRHAHANTQLALPHPPRCQVFCAFILHCLVALCYHLRGEFCILLGVSLSHVCPCVCVYVCADRLGGRSPSAAPHSIVT